MHPFAVLADPVRRRIVEELAQGEQPSGALVAAVQREFPVSQPAVSQHLKVLRDSGFAAVRAAGARRYYSLRAGPIQAIDEWLERLRSPWEQPLDALATEVARGKRAR